MYGVVGMKENRLTLIEDLGQKRVGSRNRRFGLFQCTCGNTIEIRMDTFGSTRSCGCLKGEQDLKNLTDKFQFKPKYECQDRRLYDIWYSMIKRCYIRDDRNYMKKGIQVCENWKSNFDNFAEWAYSNGYKDTLTTDRIDNSGNYEPSNCRWVDMKTQCNNRDNNISIVYKGKGYTLKELTEELGLEYGTVYARYFRGERDVDELIREVIPQEYANNTLSEEDVKLIRDLSKQGVPGTKIHLQFPNVTLPSIYNVINHKTWKNI